jgi:hypothetical protein
LKNPFTYKRINQDFLKIKINKKHFPEAAKERGASMAFLPEGFDYIAESKDDSLSMAETLDGETISAYRQIARINGIALSLGGFHCRHVVSSSVGSILNFSLPCHIFL